VHDANELNIARLELTAKLSYNVVEQDIAADLAAFQNTLRTSRGCDLDVLLYWGSDTSERESRLFLWGMSGLVKHYRQWRCVSASFSQTASPISALCSFFLSRAEHLLWFAVHLPQAIFLPPSPPQVDLSLFGGPERLEYNPFGRLRTAKHLEGNIKRLAQATGLDKNCLRTISLDSSVSTWQEFIAVMRMCSQARFISFSADGLIDLPSNLNAIIGNTFELTYLTSIDLYLNAEEHVELFFRSVGDMPTLETMYLRFFGNVPSPNRVYDSSTSSFPNLKRIVIEGVAPQELPIVSMLLGTARLQEQSFGFFLPTPEDPTIKLDPKPMPPLPTATTTQLMSVPEGMLFSLLNQMRYGTIERLTLSISLTDYYANFYELPDNLVLDMLSLKSLQILVPFSMQRTVLDGLNMPRLAELHMNGSLYPFDGPWWWEFCNRHRQVLSRITKLRLELPAYEPPNRGSKGEHPLFAFPSVETLIVNHRETASLRWLLHDPTYPGKVLPRLAELVVVGNYLPLSNPREWFEKAGLKDVMAEIVRARDLMADVKSFEAVKWCAPNIDDTLVVLRG
jgi:hypothetical protein